MAGDREIMPVKLNEEYNHVKFMMDRFDITNLYIFENIILHRQ
jgi:hypothetical protein